MITPVNLAQAQMSQQECMSLHTMVTAMFTIGGDPDWRALPDLIDGSCPTCGWKGPRAPVQHAVSPGRRLRLYGTCVECGAEVLWDKGSKA